MMDLCRHSKYFGDIWLLFGILFSVCVVFVGTPKIDEYLAFYLCYKKKNEYTNKKWSFCMRIRVSVQTNHFFGNTNTQKMAAKKKTFAQKKHRLLCICVLVYWGKEITALVYNTVVWLCQCFCCGRKANLDEFSC